MISKSQCTEALPRSLNVDDCVWALVFHFLYVEPDDGNAYTYALGKYIYKMEVFSHLHAEHSSSIDLASVDLPVHYHCSWLLRTP